MEAPRKEGYTSTFAPAAPVMSRALRCLALLPHLLAIGLALFAFAVAYGSISPGSNADFWSQFYHFFRSVLALPLAALIVVLILVVGISESEEQPPADEIDTLLQRKRGGALTPGAPPRYERTFPAEPWGLTTTSTGSNDLEQLVLAKREAAAKRATE
jgi:hypothetical protein